ncbi:MAG: molybdopterin cofactor-binding domain-containing protein [Tabrizicola sp.]|uniref:xanthine dehydrogenase family protein molybdopterin-binding subunit n=1 Tax=Tabrizicola sp. TaxID=2005166 RepID=UPI0027373A4F|nr:molybdopterin cofactor-binding domain-containing protein [Tabrizicola sp.]MDP3264677.1 molybdopterin-dependent oxidoreductase [Tabrizicola sp.]MDP3649872.1 molybdopterin-dependent oxidoreductase [Paracoccaceae bacterium]MDZ4066629.1 molybdopterin cofactor-binding domain-containing protein [Tabrizicola sp.]
MASWKTITRRSFIVLGAAVVGGAAFGAYKVAEVPANPLVPVPGSVPLNPWVIINADGITVIAPRAEMGQGISTTLAALVAEELDVDWAQIRVLHGPPAQAYYNAGFVERMSNEPDYRLSKADNTPNAVLAALPKILSMQMTGGSTGAIGGFLQMRLAGAGAREALKAAAAKRLGVLPDTLKTEAGKVIGAQTFTYAELAEEAATLVPADVALRDPSTWRFVGKSMPRLDMVAKSTGTETFGIDMTLPGMKFATVRMNPKRGGPMASFDPAAALVLPGVDQVIRLGSGIAVVANNTWTAMQAAALVDIQWGPADYPADTAAMLTRIEAAFATAPDSRLRDDGDVETELGKGDVIEAEYRIPFLAHAAMEPLNATAWVKPDGAVEVWCGNQAPILTRDAIAAALRIDSAKVTLHTPSMGGGFGGRTDPVPAVLAARIAAAMPDTPIKLTYSREEDMTQDFYRPAAIARLSGRLEGGKATALWGRTAAPSATHSALGRLIGFAPPGPDRATVEGGFDQPYGLPNYRYDGHIADLTVPLGFWRSVGNSMNAFFLESFIDELAHAAKADPLQFRLDLMRDTHAPSATLLETVRDMSGWDRLKRPGFGRGVAFCYSFGTPVAEVLEVQDTPAGIKLTRAWIACDPGLAMDPSIIEAQMTGGMVYGLSAAIHGAITFDDQQVVERNFPDYDPLRMHTTPSFEVKILQNNGTFGHIGGVGEPGTPPAAPALANALFDLTGTRARELPLNRTFNLMT